MLHKHKFVLLPNENSKLYFKDNVLNYSDIEVYKKSISATPQHIHILTDTSIDVDDWVYEYTKSGKPLNIFKATEDDLITIAMGGLDSIWKKIIISSFKDLGLLTMSEDFLKEFATNYNIDNRNELLIEYEVSDEDKRDIHDDYGEFQEVRDWIIKSVNNIASVQLCKNIYTHEELIVILQQYENFVLSKKPFILTAKEWLEKRNLEK